MKKKLWAALLLCAALVLSLAGCDGGGILDIGGKETECDFCGETKKCKEKTIWGEEYNICDDCQEELGEAMNVEPSSGLEMSKTRDDEKGIIGYLVQGPGSNTDKDLVIPSTYKDLPVIGIAREAFKDCKYLKSVVIPSSVTSISYYGYDWEVGSFQGCTGLEKVVLSDGLERLQYAAFRDCTSLKSIVIPGSVKEFGYSTFYGCTGLESVVICDGVEVIGPDTFEGCTSLAKLEVGNTVTTIESDAFRGCTALTEVILPQNVGSIYTRAFGGCENLTNVEIKNEEAEVAWNAFDGCDKIATVKIGEDIIIKYGEENGEVRVSNLSLWIENELGRRFLPEQYNLYADKKLVEELVIPEGITQVNGQFDGCLSLTKIVIPDHVTAWDFSSCINVTEIQIGGGLSYISKSIMPPNVCHVVIEEGVTELDEGLFYLHESLETIRLPGTLERIPYDCFRDCDTLTDVKLSEGITTIGAWSFAGCSGLESITIPQSVTEIESYALSWNKNLSEVTILGTETHIGYAALYVCPKLSKIVYGGTMEQWGKLKKGGGWNDDTGEYVICCADGEIMK